MQTTKVITDKNQPSAEECAAFFRNNQGFSRLMSGLLDMYIRYERCFGAVRLSDPTPEEEKAISEFFKRDYYDQALIRISLADFERQVQKIFTVSFRLETLLEAYNRRPLIRRAGIRVTVNGFSLHVENELIPRFAGTQAEIWLREVVAHMRRTYRKWAEKFFREPQKINAMFETICTAYNQLPCLTKRVETLTDFVSHFGGDAQSYGLNGEHGSLFMRALSCGFEVPFPTSAEESSALYYKAGILTEGVLNKLAVRDITAWRDNGKDEACDIYNRLNEPHILTLTQISRFTKVAAIDNQVYVVENLPVFSAVNEWIKKPCTVICLENNLNAAAIRLLELFAASGAAILFSGDMNYAGLSLADRIYLLHPKNFKPWRYGKDDYERVVTDSDFHLPDNKKDQGLHNEDLAALLSLMRKKGKIAPQSALIHDLVRDINTEQPNGSIPV